LLVNPPVFSVPFTLFQPCTNYQLARGIDIEVTLTGIKRRARRGIDNKEAPTLNRGIVRVTRGLKSSLRELLSALGQDRPTDRRGIRESADTLVHQVFERDLLILVAGGAEIRQIAADNVYGV